jgi:hypothetical protein
MRYSHPLPPAMWLLMVLVATYAINETHRILFGPSAFYVALRAAVIPLLSLVAILSGVVPQSVPSARD